jgi:[NiFe] hydrogenase diaphorase moiety large subunit
MTSAINSFFPIEPERSKLLNKLWEFQHQYGFISDEQVGQLASELDVSKVEIEGVISFYHFFHRKPSGKFTIYLNNSIISEIRGYERIKEAFERETGASLGSVDRTGTFGFFETACIGLSDQEPAALINFYPFTHLNTLKVKDIIHRLKAGESPADICDEPDDHLQYLPPNGRSIFFSEYEPGRAMKNMAQLTPEEVLEQIRRSSLSGRGGAFFPTWKKWSFCKQHESDVKFIISNADEGEPGTFKDRVLLKREPGSMLEGMALAGYAVGAAYGVIYLRAEYYWLQARLQATIDEFYELGLLGKNAAGIEGFDFDIRIQMGAGAYVCGEETALLESMEGKRGEPRTKWYFPVERGYLQKPTVVNNVETFCAAARVLEHGIDSYLEKGIPGSPGTKLISLSGDCKRPGIYEIEWGMTVAELLEHCGAQDPYMMQLSGPSGECISLNEKYNRISTLDLMSDRDIRCGGAFMIFNSQRDLLKILLNYSAFFKSESCGICTPCRAGNFIMQRKLEKLSRGVARPEDMKELQEWSNIMKLTSRCGLGKTASNSLMSSLNKFADYYAEKLGQEKDAMVSKFDMEDATEEYEAYKF